MRKRAREVKLRLTDEEYSLLQRKVKQAETSRNSFLIQLITGTPIYPADGLKEISTQMKDLNRQLRGLTTNVNQVAKIANSIQNIPSLRYLSSIDLQIKDVREHLNPLWTRIREVLYGNR